MGAAGVKREQLRLITWNNSGKYITKHQTESDRVNYEMAFGVEKCDKSPQSWILDSTSWIQDSLSKGTWVPDPNL